MAGNKLTIRLTEGQQNQIKIATGRSITDIKIDLMAALNLTEEDLEHVAGGLTIKDPAERG